MTTEEGFEFLCAQYKKQRDEACAERDKLWSEVVEWAAAWEKQQAELERLRADVDKLIANEARRLRIVGRDE